VDFENYPLTAGEFNHIRPLSWCWLNQAVAPLEPWLLSQISPKHMIANGVIHGNYLSGSLNAVTGKICNSTVLLNSLISFWEFTDEDDIEIAFILEFPIGNLKGVKPTSVVAKKWQEIIGNRLIPFDKKKREELIKDAASKNRKLAQYISAWKSESKQMVEEENG
jgi:hypothetical protein